MRRFLLFFLGVLCLLCPLDADVRYALTPIGFEDGVLPSGWTQEHITGTVDWQVEGGSGVSLTNPAGAQKGNYRLGIRRESGATTSFVTRLISPAVDVTSMINPQLCFAHAQVASFDYFDTLRVYYRPNGTTAWAVLAEYTSPISSWTQESIALEKYLQGTAYQIAFEVSDHAGKGVVLDEISIKQPSQCQVPQFQMIQPTSNSAYIEFVAGGTGYGSTADLFDVIVSDSALADPSVAQASEVEYMQKGLSDNSVTVSNLATYTTYYVYLRTNCADNESGYTDWIQTTFETTLLRSLPYIENFNQKRSASDYATPAGWTFGTNIAGAQVPYIYVGTTSSYKQYYSVDSTSYLAFTASASTSVKAIEKGSYVYAATPELNGKLQECEVAFWGTAYQYVYNGVKDYAAELTVGVMTDPTDYTTFTAIKTVKIESAYQFKHFVVSLSDYNGTGKYVALRSEADKDNVFFVDNFSVSVRSTAVPEDVRVYNVLPTGFDVSAAVADADSWNIRVSEKYVRNGGTLSAADCIVEQSGNMAAICHISSEALAGKTVRVYAQAVKNGVASAWSFPVTLRIPTVGIVPIELTMNSGKYTSLKLNTLNSEIHGHTTETAMGDVYFPLRAMEYIYPAVSTSTPTYDGGHLNLNGIDNYFVLPYIDSLDSLMIRFRLSVGSSYSTYAGQSRVAVGVMSDPYDLSTFVELGRFDGSAGSYAKCEQELTAYTGTGHYVAIRAITPTNVSSTYGSYNAIDDIVLKKIPTCRAPRDITATPAVNSATIQWDAAGMQKWLVSWYENNNTTGASHDTVVTVPSVLLSNLNTLTAYYYTVRTICGEDTIAAEEVLNFTTLRGIPFKETFTTSSLPSGWSKKKGLLSSVFCGSSLSTAYGYWYCGSNTGGVATDGYVAYINIGSTGHYYWLLMPELYINAEEDANVRLSFDVALVPSSSTADLTKRNSGIDDQFAVVISTDGGETWKREDATIWNNANDSTTDYVLNDFPLQMQKTAIDLAKYKGQKICIAFYTESTVSNANNYLLIDNVEVAEYDENCQGISRLTCSSAGDDKGTITWAAGGEQSIHIDVYADGESTKVFSGDITTTPYTLNGLKDNTLYHVDAYQSCNAQGDTIRGSFRTDCAMKTPADIGTMDFADANSLLCWTVGVGDTTSVGSRSLTMPSVQYVTKFGRVLSMKKPKSSTSYNYGNNYYAILPALDIDSIAKYQVVFDAATTVLPSDTTDMRQLYIGVITDPADLSTFEITDTLTLQYAADSVQMKSYAIGFDKYKGDYLGDYGKYIVFMVSAPLAYSDMALIDNVRIEAVSACHQILDLSATDLTPTTATLRWTSEAEKTRVVVSSVLCNPDTVQSFVFDTEVEGHSVAISSLTSNTTYYAYAKAICGEGDSARWSGHTMFTTTFGIPYHEDFNAESLSTDWKGYKTSFPKGDTLSLVGEQQSTGSTSWYMVSVPTAIAGMNGYGARVEVYGAGAYDALLVSPEIYLPEMSSDGLSIAVSFKVAKAAWSGGGSVDDSEDDKLSVMVSTDGGQTWTRSNSVVWASDGKGDYDYNAITLAAKRYKVDLSVFAGQSVNIGFFTESTITAPDTYLYIDSVSVDYYEPMCDGVSNIVVVDDSTTYRSASIVCKLANNAERIEYVFGKDSVDWATAAVHRADSAQIHLSGLEAGTQYAVYARVLCAEGDTSAWFGPKYFETKCLATIPIVYDFDDESHRYKVGSSYKMDNCWDVAFNSTYYIPHVVDNSTSYTYAYSGSSALCMEMGSYSNYYSIAAMPTIAADLDTLQLSFMARAGYATTTSMSSATDSYLHSVMVGTMDNLTDTATFHLIKEVVLDPLESSATPASDATAFWRHQMVSLEGAKGKYLVFMQKRGSKYNYIYIDDVCLSKRSDCPLVENLSVDSVADVSAYVHWTSESSNFVVRLISQADNRTMTVSDTICALTGLKPNMAYTISVASVCGMDTTLAAQKSFTTYYNLPFIESFAGGLPNDWKRMSGNILNGGSATTSSYGWTSSSTNTYGIDSPKMMWELTDEDYDFDYGYEYYEQNSVLATPSIVVDANETLPVLLSFDMALTSKYSSSKPSSSYTKNRKFAILVSEDNGKTWIKTDSLVWGTDTTYARRFDSIPNTATRYEIDFAAYKGKTIRIAFYAYSPANDASAYLHLTNVSLKEQNLNCIKPETPTVKDITIMGATFSWQGSADTYEVEVASDRKFLTLVADTIVSDTTLAVGALVPSTQYYTRVRAVCGEDGNSDWSDIVEWKTLYSVPFVEEFDAIADAFPADWERYKGVSLATVLAANSPFASATTATNWGYNSSYGDYALADGAHVSIEVYSSYSNNWLLTPVIDLTAADAPYLVFSFDAALTYWNSAAAPTATTNQRFYMIVSEDGGATWKKENLTTWSDMASDSARYALSSIPKGSGKHYNFDFSKYAGKRIQVAFGINATSNDNRLHIDNIRLEGAQSICWIVDDVTTKDKTATSLSMCIVSASKDSVWQYAYGKSGFVLTDGVALYNTSSKEFTLTNLEENTLYDVYVRSICAVGDTSAWAGPYSAKTAMSLPFIEEFDAIATIFPADWERYGNVSLTKVLSTNSPFAEAATTTSWGYNSYNGNALADSAHVGIEMYTTYSNSWLLTPVIDLTAADAPYLVFSFDAALTYWNSAVVPTDTKSQRFYVIVSEDGGKTWKKDNLITWSDMAADSARYTLSSIPTGNGTHCKLDFSKYTGKRIQIAFGINATSNDNRLHIDNVRLEGVESVCLGVDALTMDSVRAHSARVSIKPGKSDSLWQYVYGLKGFAITDSVVHTTRDATFVLSELLSDTLYDVYARSICSVGDTSEWSVATTFATGKVLPYTERFSTVDVSLPTDWTFYSGITPTTLFNGGSFANATTTTYGWGYSSSYNANALSDALHLSAAISSSYYGSTYNYWAVTPIIEMIGVPDTADIVLTFDLAMTESYGSASPVGGSIDTKFCVAVSADGGLTWKKTDATLWSDDAADDARYAMSDIGNGAGATYTINMTQYAGKRVQIAFGGIGEYMSYYYSTNVRLHLDNVCIQATSAYCFDVESVEQVSTTPASLTLAVGNNSRRTKSWQYVYGVNGFARTDSLVHTTAQPQFTLPNLMSGTRYDVYMRSICGAGDTTAWVGPFIFCTAFSLPFEEDFSTITSQNIPKAWTTYRRIAAADLLAGTKSFGAVESYSPDSMTTYWGYNVNNENALTDHNHIGVEVKSTTYNGLWLLSPIVNLPTISEDEKVVLSFDAALTHYSSGDAPKSSDNQKFYVLVSEDEGTTWNKKNMLLWSNAAADSAQYRLSDMLTGNGLNYMFDFSAYAGKNIRIAFGVEATANDNRLHIDNINLYVASTLCVADSKLSLTDKSTSSLSLLIDTENTEHQWQYAYDRSGFILSDATPVYQTTTPRFTIDQLSASTAYDVYIRTICGAGDTSKWVGPFQFKTAYGIPFMEEFYQITTKGLSADWKRYKRISSASLFEGSVSFVSEKESTESYGNWGYSYSSNALQDEQHTTVELYSSYSGAWLLSPTIDLTTVFADGKLQFSFDVALTKNSSANAPDSFDDQKFYVLVSEDEGKTWSKANALLWSNTLGDSALYRMDDILTGAGTHYAFDFSKYIGKKIQIAFGEETTTTNDNRLHLDNIALDTVSSICTDVYRVRMTSLTSRSMTIGFESAEALQWQYAYGIEGFGLSDKTAVYTIDTTQFTLANLAASSSYDVYVRSICAVGDTSAWVGPQTFATASTLPLIEPFDDMASVQSAPSGWTRYKSIAYEDLIGGKKSFSSATPYMVMGSSENCWGYHSSYAGNALADENHIAVEVYSSYSGSWLVSPILDMTMLADTQQVILSFDAALTYWSTAAAPNATDNQKFYVAISEDGGNSWSDANTITWADNASAQYQLKDIPTGNGVHYEISMASYIGKTVQIAFGVEATHNDNRLHLDNVAVRTKVSYHYAASTCNSTDYEDRYFSIAQSELQLGETQYTKQLSGIGGVADTVVTLTLDVYPAVRVALYDTICQGYAYNNYGFDLIAQNSTILPMVFTSSNGCDSLVELHLEVIPTISIDTTIMACQSYTYKGTTYYSDKVFTDTLTSSLGCDSIVRTFLLISAQGNSETEWRTSICSGDTYSDDVFAGLNRAGVYTQTVQTAYGCDSTITLYLLVANEQRAVYDTILLSDLPYIFEGETFLGANTKVGDYQHDVQSSCGQVTLYMHVYSETAIANTAVHPLYLTPNPSKVGVPVRIAADFSASHAYMLSVFSSTGQLVYRSDTPVDYLPGLSVAGIYTVRIVANGKVFQAQLLVR